MLQSGHISMSKLDVLKECLDRPGPTMVMLDSRREGVDVPDQHRGNPTLRLNLSLRFSGQLTVEDDRVVVDLRFAGTPHRCILPFSAVFLIGHRDGNPVIWVDDAPPEVVGGSQHETPGNPRAARALEETPQVERVLHAVPGPVGPSLDEPVQARPPPKLRLVH